MEVAWTKWACLVFEGLGPVTRDRTLRGASRVSSDSIIGPMLAL